MYRMPTYDPRYRYGLYDWDPRNYWRTCGGPKYSSESSSSEEEEESTDRYTEESETTTESQLDGGEYVWSSASNSYERRHRRDRKERKERKGSMYAKLQWPHGMFLRTFYANEHPPKQDKVTQKNFLSPFPSFLIPPAYPNPQGHTNYGFTVTNSPREHDVPKSSKNTAKKSGKWESDNACDCPPHDRKTRKHSDRHKTEEEVGYLSPRRYQHERILTCLQEDTSLSPSSLILKNKEEESTKDPAKGSPEKIPPRESKAKQMLSTCKGCFQIPENRKKVKQNVEETGKKSEETGEEESVKKDQEEKGSGAKKVREKLVYVVEEEGKNATKMETDLFSVNEILRIKKDLVELGEFAKKLKKLKEIKKEAEKGNTNKSSCHCKPVAELLKNVNQRIEALEARQEELERGSFKTRSKGDTETDSKKAIQLKMAGNLPPKTPVVGKKSAITMVPSFPKTEMIVSREGLSNNSEIVNELMDLKTQLQKLEKRRMSKEMTAEPGPSGETKLNKKNDRPIAVFSSRTYILTSENFEKRKNQIAGKEDVSKDFHAAADNDKSKIDQTKENVANWLKNVSANGERSEYEPNIVLDNEDLGGHAMQSQNTGPQFFTNPESQEPQQNRAFDTSPSKQNGKSLEVLMKNDKMVKTYVVGTSAFRVPCKECVMTPSGKVYVDLSSEDAPKNSSAEKKSPTKSIPPNKPNSPSKPFSPTFFKGSKKFVSRTISTCSVPSAILTKEHVKRLKTQLPSQTLQRQTGLPAAQSQSTQELTMSSNENRKDHKFVQNLHPKNLVCPPSKDKTHKESRNERMKKLESQLLALKKSFGKGDDRQSYSSYSELIRTIDLDTEKTLNSRDDDERNEIRVYSMPKIQKLNFRCLESRPRSTHRGERSRTRREDEEEARRERMRRESEEAAARERRKREAEELACTKEVTEKSCIRTVSPVRVVKSRNARCVCGRCCRKKMSEEDEDSQTSDTDSSCEPNKEKKNDGSDESDDECGEGGKKSKKKKNRLECTTIKPQKKKKRREKPHPPANYCEIQRILRKLQAQGSPTESLCRIGLKRPDICIRRNDPKIMQTLTSHKSEESFVYYLEPAGMKSRSGKEKLAGDGCALKNIFKSFRKMYPNFSAFQCASFPGNTVNNCPPQQPPQLGKHCKEVPHKHTEKHRRYSKHPTKLNRRCSAKLQSTHCPSPTRLQRPCRSSRTHLKRKACLKNCKCIRICMQRQDRQVWPGVAPPRNSSELTNESETDVSSVKSKGSVKIVKDDFIFPERLPKNQAQCVCSASTRCCKRPRKVKVKSKSRSSKKRKKREKCSKKCCMCARCGNIHEKEVQYGNSERAERNPPYPRDPMPGSSPGCQVCCQPERTETAYQSSYSDPSPTTESPNFFSFFTNYLKSKLRSKNASKPSSSTGCVLQNTSDACRANTYPQKRPKEQELGCPCGRKLYEIEDRLKCLESQSQLSVHAKGRRRKCCRRVCRCKGKERKRKCKNHSKRRSKNNCCQVYSVVEGWPGTEGEKRKSKHEKCSCSECSSKDEGEVIRTYYVCSDKDRNLVAGTESNETSETVTGTTLKTETTTGTTSEEKSSECSKYEVGSQDRAETGIKERLSSIQSLLKYFQRKKKSKGDAMMVTRNMRPESDVLGKKKGVRELTEESSSLIRKLIKQAMSKTIKRQK